MNSVEIFTNPKLGSIRTWIINGHPWFVGKDVADCLGYKRGFSSITDLLDGFTACSGSCYDTMDKIQPMSYINEKGLYQVFNRSRRPEVKECERWITEEVLPKIRKEHFLGPEKFAIVTDDKTLWKEKLAQLKAEKLAELKREREKRLAAEKILRDQAPLVAFADAVEASGHKVLIGDLAKILRQNDVLVDGNQLIAWMKDHDFLIKTGTDENLPTEKAKEMKVLTVSEKRKFYPDGSVVITRTPLVTGKGQVYFISELLKDKVKK